jgi:CheY-like chemotaxis protein
MDELILVVEDNPKILKNIQMMLEFNDYTVITSSNGIDAIDTISNSDRKPDLIISDIMMPKMDGYEFFETISKNPKWSNIPFIFLSAKASPEDIQLGKLLGVDDYITKPFQEKELLSSIKGKLHRKKQSSILNEKFMKMINNQLVEEFSAKNIHQEDICLFYAFWDEDLGPIIKDVFPKDYPIKISLKEIGVQLFQATVAIYGQEDYEHGEGILLQIRNVNRFGYIYFGSIFDTSVRGNQRQFMLCTIAPQITYFDSLHIKKIFKRIERKIKSSEIWDIVNFWHEISEILMQDH